MPKEDHVRNVRLTRLRLHHLIFAHRVQGDDPRRMIASGSATAVLVGPDMVIEVCEIVSSGMPIASNTEDEIILVRPWAVEPYSTSLFAVRVNKSQAVITENRFADASVAVQFYALSYGFIVDGNVSERTGGM